MGTTVNERYSPPDTVTSRQQADSLAGGTNWLEDGASISSAIIRDGVSLSDSSTPSVSTSFLILWSPITDAKIMN